MKKHEIDKAIETWGIFMGSCEEFPELYDKYVEKIENKMRNYGPELEITEKEKAQAIEKIWNWIKNQDFADLLS